jgi:dihydrofolate reductase
MRNMPAPLHSTKLRKNLKVYAIFATDLDGFIGKSGQIPWRVPSDLKRFRRLTKDHCVIMGRKTFESIGSTLPSRTNIIVSSKEHVRQGEEIWAKSPEEALELCANHKTVWIIGGAEIYKTFMPIVDVVHHTIINTNINGDTSVLSPALSGTPGWVHIKQEILRDVDDQHTSTYMVHARLESILRTMGFDING